VLLTFPATEKRLFSAADIVQQVQGDISAIECWLLFVVCVRDYFFYFGSELIHHTITERTHTIQHTITERTHTITILHCAHLSTSMCYVLIHAFNCNDSSSSLKLS